MWDKIRAWEIEVGKLLLVSYKTCLNIYKYYRSIKFNTENCHVNPNVIISYGIIPIAGDLKSFIYLATRF